MKRHAQTLLAALVILATPGFADAQSRAGRATGSRTESSGGSVGAASGRVASTRRSGDSVIRGSNAGTTRRSEQEPARARTASPSRGTMQGGVRGRESNTGHSSGVVTRGSSGTAGVRAGVSNAVQRGSVADRPGRASGTVHHSGSYDRGVVQGRAYGSDRRYDSRDGWYYRSYPRSGYTSYGRRVYAPLPIALRGCAFSFGYGSAGFGCIHTFAGPGYFVPFFYVYPRHVVHVQTSSSYTTSSYATPPVYYDQPAVLDDPTCVIVTVTQPGNDGYWKTLRLPVAGVVTRDQLRRLVSDRIRTGAAFQLTDVDGVSIHIPAGLQVETVAVDPCR